MSETNLCGKCNKEKKPAGLDPTLDATQWCHCEEVKPCGKCNKPKRPKDVPFYPSTESLFCNCGNTEPCRKCKKYKADEIALLPRELEDVAVPGFCQCGRPTTYSEEIILKAEEYLSNCKDTEEDKENHIKKKVKLPSIGGLAVYLNIARSTIYEWAKEYSEFSDILERLLAIQEERLLNNGLSGEYAPTITKVILTKHGYIDKQDVTSDGKAIKGNGIVFSNFKDNE